MAGVDGGFIRQGQIRHQSKAATDVVARREGTVRETGRDLDIAVLGQGLIAVADGEGEAYTRAGAMLVDSEGNLTINGRAVLGDGGPVVLPPFRAVSVTADRSCDLASALVRTTQS